MRKVADRFEGDAVISPGSIRVFAKYEDGTRYKGLLQYEGESTNSRN